ncbi:MAG: PD-(D/E)XK nuclease family protein [Bacilli bacterium]|nr:PD-(D/E)XK nuclease family protein [Bacilli bacterium]
MEKIDENFINYFNMLKIKKRDLYFFDIITPKEVIVSEWLSFILNPSINGVGNKPIEKLLEALDIIKELDEFDFISTNTEVTTDNNQRMDIVIKYDGLWIVIENKIESHESGFQTVAYYNYIESIRDNNEVIYIYLKPNYNNSIPRESNFKVLTYSKLLKKLKEISEFDYYEKDKYKYLKEFLVSGDRFMKNEELDFNESILFYMNNKEKMHEIEQEYKSQNRRLHDKIRYDILNELNERRGHYLTDDDKGTSPRNYMQFYKDNWNNTNHMGAHFELLFHTDELLSDKIKCDVVLHLENRITENEMHEFEKRGITRNRSLAFDNNKNMPIKNSFELDFSSNKVYKESIYRILYELNILMDEYEGLVNSIMSNKYM